MAVTGRKTGFSAFGGDLGDRYVSKTYLLDTYPNVPIPGLVRSNLWSWGKNYDGCLGQGDTNQYNNPTTVGSLANWKEVTSSGAGGNFFGNQSLAIKTDGTLWAWGGNYWGVLGLGTSGNTASRSSPVQVGSLTNWKQVSVAGDHTLAVKTDGTLWAWGTNNPGFVFGALGLNNSASYSSPVQVGGLTNWKLVSCSKYVSLAVKTDGTLWAWGSGSYGRLGLGSVTHRSSPVQVGSLTNWKLVCSAGYSTRAIKTDGTMWAWGQNNGGQLGLGDTAHRSSPVQVGTLTNWKNINHFNYCVKTDGTLWYFSSSLVNSPIQIGAGTDWKLVGGNAYGSYGIKTDGTMWYLPWTDYGPTPVQYGTKTDWVNVSNGGYWHTLAVSAGV